MRNSTIINPAKKKKEKSALREERSIFSMGTPCNATQAHTRLQHRNIQKNQKMLI